MYPIIGDRYRCKDCVEKIGFDLCSDCYNTCSKLPGRFNQQHTAEHQFELISSNMFRGRGRILSEPLSESISVFLAHMSAMSVISEESDRNGKLSHATSTNSETDEDNQDDSQ